MKKVASLFGKLHVADYIKNKWPEKKIVIGGAMISCIIKCVARPDGLNFLKEFHGLFDIAIYGNGEFPLLDLFHGT